MNERDNLRNDSYKRRDMRRLFGEAGMVRVMNQVAHDNPTLDADEIVNHAWSLIPEAIAYQQPISQEDLTERAILIHEGYEAERRIAD